jgi:hypothetical protein
MDTPHFVRHDSSSLTETLNSPTHSRHDSSISISTATSYNSVEHADQDDSMEDIIYV